MKIKSMFSKEDDRFDKAMDQMDKHQGKGLRENDLDLLASKDVDCNIALNGNEFDLFFLNEDDLLNEMMNIEKSAK